MAPSLVGVDGLCGEQNREIGSAHRSAIDPEGGGHAALRCLLRAAAIRSSARRAKVGFSSMPSQLRSSPSATIAVVPEPMKGSRTIPGSHRAGVLSDHGLRTYVRTRDAVECLVLQGGVLAMRPLIVHSSSKAHSATPRRVLNIEYADALELDIGIRLAVV